MELRSIDTAMQWGESASKWAFEQCNAIYLVSRKHLVATMVISNIALWLIMWPYKSRRRLRNRGFIPMNARFWSRWGHIWVLIFIGAQCIGPIDVIGFCNRLACNGSVCVPGMSNTLSFVPASPYWTWSVECKRVLMRAHGFDHCDRSWLQKNVKFTSDHGGKRRSRTSTHSHTSSSNSSSSLHGGYFNSFSAGTGGSFLDSALSYALSSAWSFLGVSAGHTSETNGWQNRTSNDGNGGGGDDDDTFEDRFAQNERNTEINRAFGLCSSTLGTFVTSQKMVRDEIEKVHAMTVMMCASQAMAMIIYHVIVKSIGSRRNRSQEIRSLIRTLIICSGWHVLIRCIGLLSRPASPEAYLYRQFVNTGMENILYGTFSFVKDRLWGLGGAPKGEDAEFLQHVVSLFARIPPYLHGKVMQTSELFNLVYVVGIATGNGADAKKNAEIAMEITLYGYNMLVVWFVLPIAFGLRRKSTGWTMRYISMYALYATHNVLVVVGSHVLATDRVRIFALENESFFGSLVFADVYVFYFVFCLHAYKMDTFAAAFNLSFLLLVCFSTSLSVRHTILTESAWMQQGLCRAFDPNTVSSSFRNESNSF